MKIKLKIGRHYCNIGENDLILDNGACYQVVTQSYIQGWNTYSVKMSKKLFNDFRKLGMVYTNEDLHQKAIERYGSVMKLTYWKFDVEYMKRCGYEVVEE